MNRPHDTPAQLTACLDTALEVARKYAVFWSRRPSCEARAWIALTRARLTALKTALGLFYTNPIEMVRVMNPVMEDLTDDMFRGMDPEAVPSKRRRSDFMEFGQAMRTFAEVLLRFSYETDVEFEYPYDKYPTDCMPAPIRLNEHEV